MYNNNTDRTCYPCGQYCFACTGPTACTNCENDLTIVSYNHNGRCKLACPTFTLEDSVLFTCTDCGPNCASCVGTPTNCDSCETGYFLDGTSCVAQCPSGKYPDPSFIC